MGFFDFFTGGNDPQKQIDKLKRILMDQYRQREQRLEAIDDLVRMGTPAALAALLERFTLRVSGPTVDEQEKQYTYEKIALWGPSAVEPLQQFIFAKDAVYFPLRALRDLAGDDVAVDTLLKAIADCDPGYHQGLDRLREVVSNLRDFRHDRVRDALIGLLQSRSNEIRFYALDGLAGYPPDQIAEHFAGRMIDQAESQRVKALAYELALEHRLPLEPWVEALAPVLPPNYALDADGHLARS
ncbi:MAG: hypothetical protein FJ100_05915 [Deltaproteobacteria bacterium]|nr:hypothetical protein [Deltaproteobacteria bacterium]